MARIRLDFEGGAQNGTRLCLQHAHGVDQIANAARIKRWTMMKFTRHEVENIIGVVLKKKNGPRRVARVPQRQRQFDTNHASAIVEVDAILVRVHHHSLSAALAKEKQRPPHAKDARIKRGNEQIANEELHMHLQEIGHGFWRAELAADGPLALATELPLLMPNFLTDPLVSGNGIFCLGPGTFSFLFL